MPPTRGCAGSAPSPVRAVGHLARSTSTTRRCSWKTPSPPKTKRPWRPSSLVEIDASAGKVEKYPRWCQCRGAAGPRGRLAHPHRLGVAERADAEVREFTAVTGTLDAAEPEFGVGHRHPVDEDLAGLDVVDEALLLGFVIGPGVGPQAERGGVGDLDRLVDARGPVHRGDRSEDFFGVERHVL